MRVGREGEDVEDCGRLWVVEEECGSVMGGVVVLEEVSYADYLI